MCQIVDTDRLGYWCLVDYAKEKLKQIRSFKIYFRNLDKGNLQIVYDDAITYLLLSELNERKEVDIYVIKDNSSEGASGSRSQGDGVNDS